MGREGILKKSTYSIVSISEVTEEALEVWRGLPAIIRQDPTLKPFRQRHENLHGNKTYGLRLKLNTPWGNCRSLSHSVSQLCATIKFIILIFSLMPQKPSRSNVLKDLF